MLLMGVFGIISAMHAAVTLLPLLGVREVGGGAPRAVLVQLQAGGLRPEREKGSLMG